MAQPHPVCFGCLQWLLEGQVHGRYQVFVPKAVADDYAAYWISDLEQSPCPGCQLILKALKQKPESNANWHEERGVLVSLYNRSGTGYKTVDIKTLIRSLPIVSGTRIWRSCVWVELQKIETFCMNFAACYSTDDEPQVLAVHEWVEQRFDVQLAKSWLRLCGEHTNITEGQPTGRLPIGFRLIDVRNRCIVEIPPDTAPAYVALSYMWEQQDKTDQEPFQLADKVYNDFFVKDYLRKKEVPRLIQDCMSLCDDLAIAYLWIDRYCIIQGTSARSAADKAVQIGAMDAVYSCAALTLVCAVNDRNIPHLPGYAAPRTWKDSLVVHEWDQDRRPSNYDLLSSVVGSSLWNTRGWTFQERLLSARRLYVTNSQILYECRCCGFAQECLSWGLEMALETTDEWEEKAILCFAGTSPLFDAVAALTCYLKDSVTTATTSIQDKSISAFLHAMNKSFVSVNTGEASLKKLKDTWPDKASKSSVRTAVKYLRQYSDTKVLLPGFETVEALIQLLECEGGNENICDIIGRAQVYLKAAQRTKEAIRASAQTASLLNRVWMWLASSTTTSIITAPEDKTIQTILDAFDALDPVFVHLGIQTAMQRLAATFTRSLEAKSLDPTTPLYADLIDSQRAMRRIRFILLNSHSTQDQHSLHDTRQLLSAFTGVEAARTVLTRAKLISCSKETVHKLVDELQALIPSTRDFMALRQAIYAVARRAANAAKKTLVQQINKIHAAHPQNTEIAQLMEYLHACSDFVAEFRHTRKLLDEYSEYDSSWDVFHDARSMLHDATTDVVDVIDLLDEYTTAATAAKALSPHVTRQHPTRTVISELSIATSTLHSFQRGSTESFLSPTASLTDYTQYVAEYTGRQLSFHSDIDNAFAGVTGALAHITSWIFVFGLPLQHIVPALLWEVYTEPFAAHRTKLVLSTPDVPSWSWMALMNNVTYRGDVVRMQHCVATMYRIQPASEAYEQLPIDQSRVLHKGLGLRKSFIPNSNLMASIPASQRRSNALVFQAIPYRIVQDSKSDAPTYNFKLLLATKSSSAAQKAARITVEPPQDTCDHLYFVLLGRSKAADTAQSETRDWVVVGLVVQRIEDDKLPQDVFLCRRVAMGFELAQV